ncbi:hypothetical protein MINS_17970 [Mycolicibacterium insubricum]|jgi:hypothetical protein|uniref:Uncharacterized protein n=1 Tax=Mycolicibacterium insubricum TaxID=444597 RepID=A0A1X0CZE5_9MYCO|nr:RsiV family protein [Mycolicibacterium insubricum]MCB9440201.1 hypothetical protein [Mycolicibacterium sp.]MCV7083883.1 hypothetical protein [Mycolicibacterium insubricum]ORA65537.1 hypothetical protein BST26_18575 [Mycolicibacterium insubricum]BBZ66368.1 hypothetical protein MINS_17970 [Mycolicibacterium insubricum]
MTQILRGLGTAAVAVALVGAGAGCHSGGSEPSASSTTGAASASSAANSTAAEPFTGYLEPVGGTKDNITYQVDLPQVRGGDTAVREKFNSSMRTALDDYLEPDESRSTTVAPGALVDDHKSAVTHVGPGSVAGVLIMNIFVERSAHPFNTVSTVVIDAHTAAPIMLSDLFTDPEAGMTKLVDGIKTAMAKDPRLENQDAPKPVADQLANWLPGADGLVVYLSVAHVFGDYFPVTVPWASIADVLAPGMQEKLTT